MLSQNQTQVEDTGRIDGHPPPMIEVEVREPSRSRKHWLILAIALIARCAEPSDPRAAAEGFRRL